MENKIDITSTVVEKGIDIARNFVDKLIMPAIEETGLLLKDQVTMWKFKNQIKMLNKAKNYCEKHNIPLKTISLKLLCPLLDYSALEEDEFLQDKWAILLSNMVDSTQNIENHVFPYILSQISKDEFLLIDKVYQEKLLRLEQLNQELETFRNEKPKIEAELTNKIKQIDEQIQEFREAKKSPYTSPIWDLQKERHKMQMDLSLLKYKEPSIIGKINQAEIVPDGKLKEFEFSNLNRLGLIKEVHETYANSQTLEIPNDPDKEYLTVDLAIEVESDKNYILTELGELFVNACKEKN